jgi:hypothetical protein
MGYADATAHRRAAVQLRPQHVVTASARLAQAGEPLLGPGQQLREYAPKPNPDTKHS